MVKSGMLPTQILSMTPIMSDKFAALGSNKYYIYLISQGALMARGAGAPFVESARLAAQRQFGTVINFNIDYGLGFYGVTCGGSASVTVTDVDLATAANWTLAAQASNQVGIARYTTKTA
jgi:hypothetical protein